eukprot:7748315-Lingulodinium_polyedra.AAC.1
MQDLENEFSQFEKTNVHALVVLVALLKKSTFHINAAKKAADATKLGQRRSAGKQVMAKAKASAKAMGVLRANQK